MIQSATIIEVVFLFVYKSKAVSDKELIKIKPHVDEVIPLFLFKVVFKAVMPSLQRTGE